jgi:hypothetical protein
LVVAAVLVSAVACSKNPPDLSSEPTRFSRTDRKTWSEQGWEGLRWGMGPGDVEVHLGPNGMRLGGVYEAQGNTPDPRLKHFTLKGSTRTCGGEKVTLSFGFLDGALYAVHEEPVLPDDFQRAVRWAWNARLELAKKWGEPTEEKGKEYLQASERGDGSYEAGWKSDKAAGGVSLFSSAYSKKEFASVGSIEPTRAATVRDLVRAASERERAERERQRAAEAAASPPATVSGKVREAITASPYTIARLETVKGVEWVAVPAISLRVGQSLCVTGAMPMQGFESKTLRRKFDVLYFGTVASTAECALP